MKEHKQKLRVGSGLSEEFSVKVGVHQGSVLSPLLFAMVIDEVTENARKGWTKQILYADDLVLMGKTLEELRENFDEWRETFESKGIRVNLGKIKLTVTGKEEERSIVRLILVACVEHELCLTRCYVQHVESGFIQDARIKKSCSLFE